MSIHPTASVHPSAVVTGAVRLGARVSIGPHAVVLGPCRIDDDVTIGPGCVIGSPPELTDAEQNLAWAGRYAHRGVEIGPRTVVRELTCVQQGTHRATSIGAGCWLLGRAYVAHDCMLGDDVTISAGAALGGNVVVGDGANLGMNVSVHQGRLIGPVAMVGMSAVVTRDVPPFAKVYGNPARAHGANTVGMRRRGIGDAERAGVDAAHRERRDPDLAGAGPEVRAAWEWWAGVSRG